jgi:hypothetical protein
METNDGKMMMSGTEHSGEWWGEHVIACVYGTMSLWTYIWTVVSFIGFRQWSTTASSQRPRLMIDIRRHERRKRP